jgi:hypothetical protein
MHEKFIANAVRLSATQMVHLQHDFETPQIEFGLPATPVELGDLRRRVLFRIE